MLAFVMEELREWRELRMTRTILLSSIALALVAAASLLQPLLLALAATLVFICFGWSEGNRYQSALSSRRVLLSFPLPVASVAAGKALSCVLTWFLTALALSPPLALSVAAWGVTPGAAAACLLSWLIAYYAALCVGFLSSLIFVRSDGLVGVIILLLWLGPSFAIGSLAPGNPLIQVWDILKGEGGPAPFLGMGGTVLAASLLLVAAALALARYRKVHHG